MNWDEIVRWLSTLRVDWNVLGSVGDTIAGIAGLGAFTVAVVVYRRQVNDNRCSQASQVIVSTFPGATLAGAKPGKPISLIRVRVDNLSRLPIFNVELRTFAASYKEDQQLRAHPIGMDKINADAGKSVEIVHGDEWDQYAAAVFDDASGNSWIRFSDGRLKPVRRRRAHSRTLERLVTRRLQDPRATLRFVAITDHETSSHSPAH